MGDFNDDPNNHSFKKVLKTVSNITSDSIGTLLYNPMEKLYNKGYGSLAYRDQWNLFDQIYFNIRLLHPEKQGYRYWKAGIFNPSFLITSSGPYKGYPYRTYSGGEYSGGYSDHFPVYLFLIKPQKKRHPEDALDH